MHLPWPADSRHIRRLVLLAGLLVLALAAPAGAATIVSSGPLTRITTAEDLACQIMRAGDTGGAFFPSSSEPGSCGTYLRVEGSVYGPGSWEPDGFEPQTLTGSGTTSDPYVLTTTVGDDPSSPSIRVRQRDTYVVGDDSVTTQITVINETSADKDVTLYRAGDCYNLSDSGFGFVAGASVACRGETASGAPGRRLLQFIPLDGDSHFFEGHYSDVFDLVLDPSNPNFPDTCRCDENIDNGAGLSWKFNVPGALRRQNEVTRTLRTRIADLPALTKSAQFIEQLPGGPNRFTISVTNPLATELVVTTLIDRLPAGFAYVPGSTTGATTQDPVVGSQGELRWTGRYAVAPGGTASLSFGVTSPTIPGTYTNRAEAEAVDTPVQPGDVGVRVVPSPTGDTTPPDTLITRGPSGETTDTTPEFHFTSTEPGSRFECLLDGAALPVCVSPVTTPALRREDHVFQVTAIDAAGNRDPTPAVRGFRVEPPPPTVGENFNVREVKGRVRVALPPRRRRSSGAASAAQSKGRRFVPLGQARQIPIGSFVDTRSGTVEVTSAASRGRTQESQFFSGVFQVLQRRSTRPVTELRLKGGSFAGCRAGARRSSTGDARTAQRRRRVRRLWGDGRGRFRTRGRYASATVRGTRWLVEDRCDGTLTRVTRGSVVVRDLRRRRNITVRRGRSYLARARATRRG